MTERELFYIRTIAETKSFSKAAQQLFISQSSLSQCVASVEKELGTPLFVRSTKGLSLTKAGERYYKTACEILKIYDDFTQEISEFNELKRGKINLGIPSYLSLIILPDLLPKFSKLYPGISIELIEKNSTELESLVLSRTLDFAIIHTIPEYHNKNSNSLDFLPLKREPFVIVLPKGDPAGKFSQGIDEVTKLPMLDLKYLQDYPFIQVSHSSRLRMFIDYIMGQADIKPNVIFTTRIYETARRLACAGMGTTLIPWEYHQIFENKIDAASYFAIPKKYQSAWETSLVTAKGGYISKASKVFMELAIQAYRRE